MSPEKKKAPVSGELLPDRSKHDQKGTDAEKGVFEKGAQKKRTCQSKSRKNQLTSSHETKWDMIRQGYLKRGVL